MSEVTNLTIDKAYLFGPDKMLEADDVPYEAAELLERTDDDYRHASMSHFQRVIDAARPPVSEGGAPYAIFTEPGASKDTALVATLPYCNPVIPDVMDPAFVVRAIRQGDEKAFDSNTWNNGEKHLFLYDMLKALGIRDEAGDPIPVITVGADSQDFQPRHSAKQKRRLKNGNLGPYVWNAAEILDQLGYGRLHVSGYSQGASVAHQFIAQAGNFDVASAVIAEPPTYKDRRITELAQDYMLDPDPNGETKWTAHGPQSRQDLEQIQNGALKTMAQTIALRGAWRTALALRHGTLPGDLKQAAYLRGHFPLTLGWNATSRLTHDIEPALFGEKTRGRGILDSFRDKGRLRNVNALGHEEVGAPHLAGESPMYYALMIGESIRWAVDLDKSADVATSERDQR